MGIQAANAFNHRNNDVPNTQLDSGKFGLISGLRTAEGAGPKTAQLSARITF